LLLGAVQVACSPAAAAAVAAEEGQRAEALASAARKAWKLVPAKPRFPKRKAEGTVLVFLPEPPAEKMNSVFVGWEGLS